MWWRYGVLYQVYPRSFQDSDGDGIGDLRGIVSRLDHLEWLGIDGIWLNPTMPSPNDDWGYDVSDYCGVHPDLGTLEDLDALIAEAARRDIRILLDLVPNHTSDRHPWFRDALEGRDADRYVWAERRPDGSPPNNWRSAFGGSAWELEPRTGRYYLHNFLPSQPDLNWWNPEVADEFDEILRFWFDRGVSGFRIDVCHAIVKDRELRDDPAATEADHPEYREKGWRPVFSMNRPDVHDVLRRWRRIADRHAAVLVGETYVLDLDALVPFYGDGSDELHLAFNFLFLHSRFDVRELRAIVEHMEAHLPEAAWPVWTGSNHDAGRLMSRWCGDDEALARCALVMLLTLRGTPVLYYGDEIAMPEVPVDPPLDPVPKPRDKCRTPMQWGDREWVDPWLPVGSSPTVAAQRADPSSTLTLVRDLIALRREFVREPYASLDAPEGAWAWSRGDDWLVALNVGGEAVAIEVPAGEIAIATDRSRDHERVHASLVLGPRSAAVVRRM